MSKKRISILLIEDNPRDVDVLREELGESEKLVFDLQHVVRLSEGLAYLSDNLQTDIILLDLNLPDCQGIQTFEKMHSGSLNLPIIVLTGTDDDELALEAVGLGAQDYLVKGRLEKYGLIRAICYAIERNQLSQELSAAREIEKFLAYHDFLTELPNRHLFYES